MLDFSDQPYVYFPPKPNRALIRLFQFYNRMKILPGPEHRISTVEMTGAEQVRTLAENKAPILFVPNHPTHSDPQVFFEALRRCGVDSQFMAAYDVFLRSRAKAWIMRRTGAFAVDRDGSDSRAVKDALRTLSDTPYALTIFPEGNVYLQNDRVTPFNEGAAMIALKALKSLRGAETGLDAEVWAVPVSLKYSYLDDVLPAVREKLEEAAMFAGTTIDGNSAPLDELKRIGLLVLEKNLKMRGWDLGSYDRNDLPGTLQNLTSEIIAGLERKMEITPRPKDLLVDRIRKCRREIHAIRSDPQRAAEHAAATGWADEAMTALKLSTYDGSYVSEKPTLDRLAETVEKVSEDMTGKPLRPFGRRMACVRFNEPIMVSEYLESFSKKARTAVRDLTGDLETRVGNGLFSINSELSTVGSRMVSNW